MDIHALDHIVLVVADVARTRVFYEQVLGLRPVEGPPGRWALPFGAQKISLQPADNPPALARGTTRGSGNFCLLAAKPMAQIVDHLRACEVEIAAGPARREGAVGPLLSVYFYDPDGNLVEVANQLTA